MIAVDVEVIRLWFVRRLRDPSKQEEYLCCPSYSCLFLVSCVSSFEENVLIFFALTFGRLIDTHMSPPLVLHTHIMVHW